MLLRVDAGDEKRLIRRAQASNAEPFETTRCKGDNPVSCFVAVTAHRWRGLVTSGSDAALMCDGR